MFLRYEACSISFHRLMIENRAWLFIQNICQRSEHGSISLVYETCSVSFHRLVTTDRAWLFIPKICNMLCQLSSSNDNGQSRVIPPSSMIHARSAVIVSCQWSEQGYLSLRYETCSISCHRLMTTVRTWLYIPEV